MTILTTIIITIIITIVVGSSLYANLYLPTMARHGQPYPHYAFKVEKVHYNNYRNSEIFKMSAHFEKPVWTQPSSKIFQIPLSCLTLNGDLWGPRTFRDLVFCRSVLGPSRRRHWGQHDMMALSRADHKLSRTDTKIKTWERADTKASWLLISIVSEWDGYHWQFFISALIFWECEIEDGVNTRKNLFHLGE